MAERLLAEGHSDVDFVGTPHGLEARLVPEAGVRFFVLPARGFDRSKPLSLIVAILIIALSTVRAVALVMRRRPDVVIGFGGYVSIPVGLAALVTRRPLVLHEQNSVPGLANRVLSRWAHTIAVTYDSSARHFTRPERVTLTGNPVRPAVLRADRASGRLMLGIPESASLLLVFGGSRGARHINTVVARARDTLLSVPDAHVVHVAGPAEHDSVAELLGSTDPRYHVVDYIDDMGSALAAADLVVARAGATSIAEITALGRPSVLVPYPYATDDHQTGNARGVQQSGGAVVFADADIDSPAFIETVTNLLADASARATMAAAAARLGHADAANRVSNLARIAAGEQLNKEAS